MNILKVREIKKSYKQQGSKVVTNALDGVSFDITGGEFVAVMGPSGSGKTTMFNAISGVDRVDSGSVMLMSHDISSMDRNELAVFRRQHIGMVFQDFNLIDSLNVRENIMVPMVLDGKDTETMKQRVSHVADIAGIADILEKHTYEISGGQQQRVAICRALLNDPDIILADEPTGNLDSNTAKQIMQYFDEMNQQGCTIMMVTHDALSASFCKKIIFLKDGKIISKLERKKESKNNFYERILEELISLGKDH